MKSLAVFITALLTPLNYAAAYQINDVIDLDTNLKGEVLKVDGANIYVSVTSNPDAKPTGALSIKDTYTLDQNNIIPTQIKAEAFKNNTDLTSIAIGSNVEIIGTGAFSGCTKLNSVNLPTYGKLYTVAEEAFANTKALSNISMPKVEFIGKNAFLRSSIESAIFPAVKTIDVGSFQECKSLTTFEGGNKLTSIGNIAFCNCEKLSKFTFTENITEIGSTAFAFCLDLNTVVIPMSLANSGSDAFVGSDIRRIFILSPDFMNYCDNSCALAHRALSEIYCLSTLVSDVKDYLSTGGEKNSAEALAQVQPQSMESAIFEMRYQGGDNFMPIYKVTGISDLKVYDATTGKEIEPQNGEYTILDSQVKVSYLFDNTPLTYITCLERDSDGVIDITFNERLHSTEYYDLNGHKVRNPTSGIYIRCNSDGSTTKIIR